MLWTKVFQATSVRSFRHVSRPLSSAPGVSELTLGSEAKHFLDIEDESVSTYIRELAAAAASVELAPEARTENPPTILRGLTLLDPSQILKTTWIPQRLAPFPLTPGLCITVAMSDRRLAVEARGP